jgi:hypothetical protein
LIAACDEQSRPLKTLLVPDAGNSVELVEFVTAMVEAYGLDRRLPSSKRQLFKVQ